jgi:hypothetical protein
MPLLQNDKGIRAHCFVNIVLLRARVLPRAAQNQPVTLCAVLVRIITQNSEYRRIKFAIVHVLELLIVMCGINEVA